MSDGICKTYKRGEKAVNPATLIRADLLIVLACFL